MTISSPQHYRIHNRDVLIDELEGFAADRERHGKHGRAAGAREAAAELVAGAKAVYFERMHRVVGSADRYSLYAGTRDEVLAELDVLGVGYLHQGDEEKAREVSRAMYMIKEERENCVRVGHLVYQVAPYAVAGTREEVIELMTRSGMAAARSHSKDKDYELYDAREAVKAGAAWAYAAGTRYDIITES